MTDIDMSEPAKGSERSSNSSRKASTTVSTRSSRRTASPSRASKQDDAGPPTPESPPFRLTRKRAASLADKADGRDEQPDGTPEEVGDEATDIAPTNTTHSRMSSGGASAGSAGSAASHVCLCQPDPKIPRPRNAFILYRQHHQAAIVAQHPGLANPDISKIIGEQWKAQPESVRSEWKALAEEEKIRHQQQYPEYRYQPRRGGRRGSLSALNTNPDKHHCNKCGGRSITTPTTPFSATHQHHHHTTTTTPSSSTPMLPPPTPSTALTPSSRYLPPMMSNLAINTAQAQAAATGANNNNNTAITTPSTTATPTLHRRTTANAPRPTPTPSPTPATTPATTRPPSRSISPCCLRSRPTPSAAGTPYPFPGGGDPRRQSLPRMDGIILRGPSPRHPHPHALGVGEGSLTLPPLQTGGGADGVGGGTGGSPATRAAGAGVAADPQARSVEAMVMSMPFWGKIRVLGKIAPPLRGGGGAGPGVRGAIVSVEGDEGGEEEGGGAAVAAMCRWLEESLGKCGENWVRVGEAPRGPGTVGKEGKGAEAGVDLGEYIKLIGEWHGWSREMVEFITTAPDQGGSEEAGAGASVAERKEGAPEGVKKTPVLIMPTYNLRAADAWASKIPITDNYSPADHWQWVATLWRGIVGPDITIYIKDVSHGELEMAGGKAVEVREDGQTKCLIVKRVRGKDIEESALRRLGFEVGELIRSVSVMKGK
ncbi:hypothetical protein B0J12DRAFT_736665 [Macrophomina phaseolina]|nr:hypothetical protein B0J12DRAFT_736665 [Macrophomina phaseolina]